jgi:molecular chaperone GrpE
MKKKKRRISAVAETKAEEIKDENTASETEENDTQEAKDTADTAENTEETAEKTEESTENAEEEKSDPQEEIDKLTKQLADEKERYLRLDAEYYNFRQRSVKEKSEAYESAAVDAAKEIISVIDNFERAVASECSDVNFKKGVDMIFKQYLAVLEKLGIKEIEAEGKPFDPNFHNAVSSVEDENLCDNSVAVVLQKGYTEASG